MKYDIEMIREKLTDLINFYEDKNLQSLSYNKCFNKTVDMLDRAKREFDASLFFILMFGPLKAGKSTLTNLLARKYVSPTGFGIETTLRPSLIMKSRTKEYVIDIYEIIDGKDNKEELFNLVMDVLRGIMDFQLIKSRIRKVTIPLTQQNVENQLIRYLDSEPLVTVLNVPGGDLITEHIALIDMPGLDGIKSNWEDSVVHKWILKRADFLIFIQSSMAALNKATFDFLQDAYLGSRKPPLWLVQNIIDAKYWRSDEERQADNDSQRRNAKEHISSLLGISEDLRSTAINLGKASDGMNVDNLGYLLDESGFLEFENNLKDILNESRVRIQQENSVKGVLHSINNCRQEFEDYKEELKGTYANYDERIMKLAEPQNILDSMCKVIKPDAIKQPLEIILKGLVEDWKKQCYIYLDKDRLFRGIGTDTTKDELQKRVENVVDDINTSRKEDYLEDSYKYKQEINDLAKQYICDIQGDNFTKLNNCLLELGIKPFENNFGFVSQLDWVSFSMTNKISNTLKRVNGFEIKFIGKKEEKIDKNISDLCTVLKYEYDEYTERMLKKMISEISKEFDVWMQHSYRDVLWEYLNEQTEYKKQEILREKDKIEDTLAYIEQLELMCNNLEQFINNTTF
ncbi:MAG: dynamin family protein [Ruminococcus flavefaciens]|nr:dynamin family protein [Ruminococcus flavefaciens]